MVGETDLKILLRYMKPELNEGVFVFCTFDNKDHPTHLDPIAWFHEKEGITVIVSKDQADKFGLSYSFVSAWITLTIHSSLEAVGLTAAVSSALAQVGISCNMVAAYHHDHVFVPLERTNQALKVLQSLTSTPAS
ncbi:MAG: hypothetical protein CL609_25145 [Anaerolineaceae bacterium]|nr:hypothetical protein [Anaerolineaceae bacterium]